MDGHAGDMPARYPIVAWLPGPAGGAGTSAWIGSAGLSHASERTRTSRAFTGHKALNLAVLQNAGGSECSPTACASSSARRRASAASSSSPAADSARPRSPRRAERCWPRARVSEACGTGTGRSRSHHDCRAASNGWSSRSACAPGSMTWCHVLRCPSPQRSPKHASHRRCAPPLCRIPAATAAPLKCSA